MRFVASCTLAALLRSAAKAGGRRDRVKRDTVVWLALCLCSPRSPSAKPVPRRRVWVVTHTRTQPSCIHAQFRRDTTLSRSTGALVSQPTDAQYRSSTLWHSWVQAQTRQNPTCTGRQCYPGFSRTARPHGGHAVPSCPSHPCRFRCMPPCNSHTSSRKVSRHHLSPDLPHVSCSCSSFATAARHDGGPHCLNLIRYSG